jgi:acetyl esterase/lipase
VGTIDLFHDEAADYAHRLREAGVDVELHEVEGMFHAAEALGFVPSMKMFRSSMVAALGRVIGEGTAAQPASIALAQ